MITWDQLLNGLREDVLKKAQLERELDAFRNTGLAPAREDEEREELRQRIAKRARNFEACVEHIARFPRHHDRHFALLDAFWGDGSYEKSVFVMTKYPNGAAVIDQKLLAVIGEVKRTVQEAGYRPRLASDRMFHPQMWDNIELYLIGCARGIAIVENKHTDETNPNVSMEWGWMRGMGRKVLYLIEKDFPDPRADFKGFISERFDFEAPAESVSKPIQQWLNGAK